MNPFETVRRAFRPQGSAADLTWSIMLLEKHHRFLRKETLTAAAEKAYGRRFNAGDPDYMVAQSATSFVKAGPETIHVTQASHPLEGGSAHEVETKHADHHFHHRAWQQHTGYVALDLWNKDRPRRDAYRVLAPLAKALLTENVTGIFFPRDNELFPNDGSAAEHLAHLSA